jgi:hypothetical protein
MLAFNHRSQLKSDKRKVAIAKTAPKAPKTDAKYVSFQ